MQDKQKEEIAENMSLSLQNVHVTYKTKLLPSQSLKTRGLSTVGEPANEGGRSPSIESLPHHRGDVETTVVDIKYSASSLSPNPNQPSLPPVGRRRSVVGKLQRRQATNPYLNQLAVEIYGESMKDYILNHRLFWHWVPEDKLTGLSISSVVEATLDQGNEKDISDMFKMIGVEKAADVFKHGISGFRTNYREDTIAYFSDYFKRHVPEYSN